MTVHNFSNGFRCPNCGKSVREVAAGRLPCVPPACPSHADASDAEERALIDRVRAGEPKATVQAVELFKPRNAEGLDALSGFSGSRWVGPPCRMLPAESLPDDRYVIVFGESGYVGTPLQCMTARWDAEREDWRDHAGNVLEFAIIYWLPLPAYPQ